MVCPVPGVIHPVEVHNSADLGPVEDQLTTGLLRHNPVRQSAFLIHHRIAAVATPGALTGVGSHGGLNASGPVGTRSNTDRVSQAAGLLTYQGDLPVPGHPREPQGALAHRSGPASELVHHRPVDDHSVGGHESVQAAEGRELDVQDGGLEPAVGSTGVELELWSDLPKPLHHPQQALQIV